MEIFKKVLAFIIVSPVAAVVAVILLLYMMITIIWALLSLPFHTLNLIMKWAFSQLGLDKHKF